MKTDSKERCGTLTRFFHWSMAFLIGWQFLKFFDRLDDGEHWVGATLVPWHVSIGTLLLVLVALRLAWSLKQRHLQPEPLAPSTAFLVKAGHRLLYVGMVLMPITGILYILGNGYPLTAFGVELVAGGDEVAWMISVGGLHSPIAWALMLLTAGHILMALFHRFAKDDGIMQRML